MHDGDISTCKDIYRIEVHGRLDESWSDWCNGMAITSMEANDGNDVTTLTGPVADQAALRGLLCRLWDLNLTIISVERRGSK